MFTQCSLVDGYWHLGQPHVLDWLTLKTGPTGCFEKSVAKHQSMPPNAPEVRKPGVHCGGSLKYCNRLPARNVWRFVGVWLHCGYLFPFYALSIKYVTSHAPLLVIPNLQSFFYKSKTLDCINCQSFSYWSKIPPSLKRHWCLFCHRRSGLKWPWNSEGLIFMSGYIRFR